jgi:hypothetical protein
MPGPGWDPTGGRCPTCHAYWQKHGYDDTKRKILYAGTYDQAIFPFPPSLKKREPSPDKGKPQTDPHQVYMVSKGYTPGLPKWDWTAVLGIGYFYGGLFLLVAVFGLLGLDCGASSAGWHDYLGS